MNNLIVLAGEFMKWFNLNFEGESREEIDFKDNKYEIWGATGTLAKVIIDGHSILINDNKNPKELLTKHWWNTNRFLSFAGLMSKRFDEDSELMPELRNKFRAQKDKLSYYDLFQFIEHRLEIKLQNWEEDAIEGRLDRLGMAFIEFNEFNEFCLGYGIDF